MATISLAVLVSGHGTTLQAIIDAIDRGELDARISVVLSSRRKAYALERAARHGLAAECLARREFASEEEYSRALLRTLAGYRVDLVVLAGFMSILTPEFIAAYRNRIMNVHPALVPSFYGKHYYGHHVHEKVLEYGVKITGCTVMFVDEGVDTGPVILQAAVPVREDDTVESLTERVQREERRLYIQAIQLFAENRLRIEGRKVRILPAGTGG